MRPGAPTRMRATHRRRDGCGQEEENGFLTRAARQTSFGQGERRAVALAKGWIDDRPQNGSPSVGIRKGAFAPLARKEKGPPIEYAASRLLFHVLVAETFSECQSLLRTR